MPLGSLLFSSTVAEYFHAQDFDRIRDIAERKQNHVTPKREEINALGVIKNLHKGSGLPVAWVLLIDTIAGALVVMSPTGFLLWSNIRSPRLLAGALAGGSPVWALGAAVPAFG